MPAMTVNAFRNAMVEEARSKLMTVDRQMVAKGNASASVRIEEMLQRMREHLSAKDQEAEIKEAIFDGASVKSATSAYLVCVAIPMALEDAEKRMEQGGIHMHVLHL